MAKTRLFLILFRSEAVEAKVLVEALAAGLTGLAVEGRERRGKVSTAVTASAPRQQTAVTAVVAARLKTAATVQVLPAERAETAKHLLSQAFL
jgi:ABC-type molybdenum transport system ATPase subunit/photorepair protein PhrA